MEQQTGSKLGKEYTKAVHCHPAYLTYAEYIMQNAGLDEVQTGIKIARRNIKNLRDADDTTLMAESKEELKSLLVKVKEKSKKSVSKLSIQKNKDRGIGSHHFMANSWGNSDSKITADSYCSHEIKRCLLLGRKAVTNLDSILKAQTLLCHQSSI